MERSRMLRGSATVALAVGLALPILLLPSPSYATGYTVSVQENLYDPEIRQVRPGDQVKWRNDGQIRHTVTFKDGSFNQELNSTGAESSSKTFSSLGDFKYYCEVHGESIMSGIVRVTNSFTSSPTATATGTITITLPPSPRPTSTRKSTKSPTPRATTSPSPSASPTPSPTPTPTFSPTPTPTETTAAPIPTITDNEPTSSSGNTQALLAIAGVLLLGALGFLVYRRTLSSP